MSRSTAIFIIGVLFPILITAREGGANDYFIFGDGITFDFGNLPLPDRRARITLRPSEACSTVLNYYGSPLFFTDGVTLFNRTHRQQRGAFEQTGRPSFTYSSLNVADRSEARWSYVLNADKLYGANPGKGLNYKIYRTIGWPG